MLYAHPWIAQKSVYHTLKKDCTTEAPCRNPHLMAMPFVMVLYTYILYTCHVLSFYIPRCEIYRQEAEKPPVHGGTFHDSAYS